MQKLRLAKEKTFDNFIKEKLDKKSLGYKEEILRTLRRLDEYSVAIHGKSREDIAYYISNLSGTEREDETIGWVQGFLDYIAEIRTISYKVYQVYISHIKKYLKYFKIRVDFKDEIELPPKLMEERYAISVEEITNIINRAPWKKKGYYLSLISTGARPIEIMSLRKKDFTWTGRRWKAQIPAKYTKKKLSRTVFFSLETTPYIGKLLKGITDEQRPFPKNPDCPDEKLYFARSNETNLFAKYCDSIGYTQKYESTNFHKLNLYCFRAYFFTKALRALTEDKDTAHAMIGHGAYLSQYQRRTDEEKEELYYEVEPSILIFDQTTNKEKIRKLTEANNKLERMEQQMLEIDSKRQRDAIINTEKIKHLEEKISSPK
jgi:integrase